MKHKLLSVLAAAMLVCLITVPPAGASGPKPPAGLIPVDMDPYFKSISGQAAAAKIKADTLAAMPQLEQAKSSAAASGAKALGVGDVEWLYADGWRQFTLRAIGDNAEIWVANDLSYCPTDPRPPHVVTQEQVEYLLHEFNTVVYPSNTN